jgi:hypothetical protein
MSETIATKGQHKNDAFVMPENRVLIGLENPARRGRADES